MSDTTTRGVRVQVSPRYLEEQSDPRAGLWAFAYHVVISNEGAEPVQLLSRHWIITDANGRIEEVRGPGVVGQQPLIAPGESWDYVSGCPLGTAMGTMHGSYRMRTARGDTFDAEIAPFTLAEPYSLN
jgi:ApaG protein